MPTVAIQRGTQGAFVYVVKPDQTVGVRGRSQSARPRATTPSIDEGISPGELVVVDGADKLRDGSKVEIAKSAANGEAPARSRKRQVVNLSRPFILRPVATSLLMVALLLAGAVAYRQLPVSALPQVDYPTIQVVTFYPGASPDVMASSVTAPLERQFGQMPGLNQMTSTQLGRQLGHHAAVHPRPEPRRGRAGGAGRDQCGVQLTCRSDLPNPPIYSKVNPADAPVLTLALTSKTLPLPQVRGSRRHAAGAEDLAAARRRAGEHQRRAAPGGADAGQSRRRWLPTASSLEDLRTAIAAANVNQAKGNFDGPQRAFTIGANDQLLTSSEYRPLIVAYRNGAPVQLSDVADVIDDAENVKQAAWMNDVPAVIVNIQRQPGANIIEVVDRIKKLLPQLQGALPASVQVSILTDRTTTIRASVRDVQFELMLTVALVVMVIFLFLRNLAATVIPSVAVPLSLVGTFGVMYLLGFSLNNLSLMALTISTGFVVDDAIVMIENIARYIEEGDPPLRGGAEGRRADRLHHPVADRLADRRADPAAVHGRHRGAAVPRVRHHAERDHSDLGRRLADADADDVRAAAQAQARVRAERASTASPAAPSTG